MKKIFLLNVLMFAFFLGFSQEKDVFITNVSISVNTAYFEKGTAELNSFIKKTGAIIKRVDANETSMTAEFQIDEKYVTELDSLAIKIGYLRDKNINTSSFNEQVSKINTEIKYLEEKKKSYETELTQMGNKDDRYYSYWQEARSIEKRIFELQSEMINYKTGKSYSIIFNIYDDTVDLTAGDISWVNMPGVSFDFLSVENPLSSISAQQYMGYSIKYMVTKGKSHFTIGALKEFSDEVNDTTRYSELFHFGFGQDFYTKHFGRGKRKWLNLYSGYNVGGMFATGETTKTALPYLTAYFGLEIFKNRYILLDNKVGYFVPFKYNRDLRGVQYHVSFNFVF